MTEEEDKKAGKAAHGLLKAWGEHATLYVNIFVLFITDLFWNKSFWALFFGLTLPFIFAIRLSYRNDEMRNEARIKEDSIAKVVLIKDSLYEKIVTDSMLKRRTAGWADTSHKNPAALVHPPAQPPVKGSAVKRQAAADSAYIFLTLPDAIGSSKLHGSNSAENDFKVHRKHVWLVYTGMMLLLSAWLLYWLRIFYRQKKQADEWIADKDPDDLRQLFKDYDKQTKLLGSPRKIIRFANKVRLQYGLLKNSGDNNLSGDRLKLFFLLLLALEKRRDFAAEDSFDAFWNLLKAKVDYTDLTFDDKTINALARQVYFLNRQVIV